MRITVTDTDSRCLIPIDERGLLAECDARTERLEVPIVCCDCGLSHVIRAEVRGGKLIVTLDGDDDLTDRARKIARIYGVAGFPREAGVSQALVASGLTGPNSRFR